MIDRKAYRTISYGLYVIASRLPDGRKAACVANTFQQIASDPAKVSVSLNKQNATTEAALSSGKFTASVLAQSATMDLIGPFGFHSSLDTDKFDGIEHDVDACDMPCLTQDCVATFSVDIEQTIDVGSHMLLIGSVTSARVLSDQPPLTYAYYHEVLRGKTPPKAASYQGNDSPASGESDATAAESEAAKPGEIRYAWRCTICGHIEYVDELPDDFTCPICGVGREFFERIEV